MLAALQSSMTLPLAALHASQTDAPEWVHLLPSGTFSGVDGRGPYQLVSAQAVIDASMSAGRKLPVDINHAIDLKGAAGDEAPAVGWIIALEARSDGIWGRIEWTPEGRAIRASKSYGFISPVIAHGAGKPHKVDRLLRAALTNNPNLTLTALHAAQKGDTMDTDELLAALRSALGLDESADGEAIIGGIKKLTESRNSADPALFVPIATFQQTVAELNKLRSGVSLQAAESIADEAIRHGKIMPFMREWAVSLCQANAVAFNDFLEGAGKPITAFIEDLTTPSILHGRQPPSKHSAETSGVAKLLGHSADDMRKYGGDHAHEG